MIFRSRVVSQLWFLVIVSVLCWYRSCYNARSHSGTEETHRSRCPGPAGVWSRTTLWAQGSQKQDNDGSHVAACAVPLAILWALRQVEEHDGLAAFARGLLVFLIAVQVLLLPINYGVLIVDKALPRVATLGESPLAEGKDAWLVWEGKDGVTFLVRSHEGKSRVLVTLPRAEVKRTEILGFDRILPTLFGNREENKG